MQISWSSGVAAGRPVYDAATAIDSSGNINVIGGTGSSGAAVTNVWTTPLPAYPNLTFVEAGTYYNADFSTYDGTAHAGAAFAYAADGLTPIAGSFSYTYNGSSAPPVNAGTYQLIAHFVSADPAYVHDSYLAGSLVIQPAFPTIGVCGDGSFPYDAEHHGITATVVGIDGQTPVAGTFSYSYNGSSSTPVAPGTYSAVATFNSSDPNYNTWTDPAPGVSTPITITIPDPTLPTNFVSTPASTTSTTLSWNAAWEPDANLTPASSYTITEKIITASGGGKGSRGSTTTYQTVASGITSTSYTISVPAGDRSFAVNSVDGNGPALPRRLKHLSPGGDSTQQYGLHSLHQRRVHPQHSSRQRPCDNPAYRLVYSSNPAPSISMLSGPPTMSFDPATDTITYSPTESEVGTATATFQATNFVGTATTTLTFQVKEHPILVVTGGTFNFGPFDPSFGPSQHPATAAAYATDGRHTFGRHDHDCLFGRAARHPALSVGPV